MFQTLLPGKPSVCSLPAFLVIVVTLGWTLFYLQFQFSPSVSSELRRTGFLNGGLEGWGDLFKVTCLESGKIYLKSRSNLFPPVWPHFLSLFSRTPSPTTCGRHCPWQSPGEVRKLTRICTACGCFPGSPFCQAPSWIPEVFSTTTCGTMELCEEHHLLSSYVSLCSLP
jgi:hypothetical protein